MRCAVACILTGHCIRGLSKKMTTMATAYRRMCQARDQLDLRWPISELRGEDILNSQHFIALFKRHLGADLRTADLMKVPFIA